MPTPTNSEKKCCQRCLKPDGEFYDSSKNQRLSPSGKAWCAYCPCHTPLKEQNCQECQFQPENGHAQACSKYVEQEYPQAEIGEGGKGKDI